MKAGHGEICALLERYGAAPPPSTSPRSRHQWKQITPAGAVKFNQIQQHPEQHRAHRQLHQNPHIQQARQLPVEKEQIDMKSVDVGVSGNNSVFGGGHLNVGNPSVSSGSSSMQQQGQLKKVRVHFLLNFKNLQPNKSTANKFKWSVNVSQF